jgi:hypothetical protein
MSKRFDNYYLRLEFDNSFNMVEFYENYMKKRNMFCQKDFEEKINEIYQEWKLDKHWTAIIEAERREAERRETERREAERKEADTKASQIYESSLFDYVI